MKPFNFDIRLLALFVFVAVVGGLTFFNLPKDTKPSLEDKLTQLKELRADKAAHQKAIYLDDQKIIPLKCSVYSEVGAKDTWESECRDEFEQQKSEIQSKVEENLETDVVPEYQ